ncbi:hypothetical protein IFM58399_04890 [Aspergillus lentulus]|uniref:Uncharacterized protein n=1 Tax=Aspergillus lentulus TaxID=293939 RepID=A0ABQ1AAV6_ASPLE|nr:uncharacterized protein IFM58399_04890 [Aspergillus lentulus]GFF37429.1 hypothetical protein IFM58399_04890 [Aspergillus lentulus]GFF50632.1 hypothetical protein IFM62136_01583 [Aspergillus lentulus]GFF66088.1 hypothetical protein IFM47457_01260 [Aspergillus lentulus]GFF77701.1 hypothetical protein IFM60648_05025 [Aspergillus lentulus]GFG02145.1 hypothetical protein IFM61392_02144 [Aspergillus lentulus]
MPSTSDTRKRAVARILDRLSRRNEPILTISQCQQIGVNVVSIELEEPSTSAQRPHFFQAISRDWFAKHPMDPYHRQLVEQRHPHLLLLEEYDAEVASKTGPEATLEERLAADPQSRVQQIEIILNHHIWHATRVDMPKGQSVLIRAREWSYVNMDDSPTLSEIYLGYRPLGRRSEHPLSALYEVDDQRLPHVTMVVAHYSEEEAGDGILTHELAYILLAMQVRYSQPEFREYKTIPVLLLSFMTPQHGRIMEAYLEGGKLTLGVSRMYSFKTNSEAPFELFEGWLLGNPVGLTPAYETSDRASHETQIAQKRTAAAGGEFAIGSPEPSATSEGGKENKRPLRSQSAKSGGQKKRRK